MFNQRKLENLRSQICPLNLWRYHQCKIHCHGDRVAPTVPKLRKITHRHSCHSMAGTGSQPRELWDGGWCSARLIWHKCATVGEQGAGKGSPDPWKLHRAASADCSPVQSTAPLCRSQQPQIGHIIPEFHKRPLLNKQSFLPRDVSGLSEKEWARQWQEIGGTDGWRVSKSAWVCHECPPWSVCRAVTALLTHTKHTHQHRYTDSCVTCSKTSVSDYFPPLPPPSIVCLPSCGSWGFDLRL